MLVLRFLIPFQEMRFGWVEITDKNVENDEYYISADLGDENPISIKNSLSEKIIYENSDSEVMEIAISQVWNTLKSGETYFMRIKTHLFRSTYKLEKLYEE